MPPTIRLAPPAARTSAPPVCPILTLGMLSPPSALVGTPQSIQTVACLGAKCAFFHAAGACSVLVMGDAMLAQAHAMIDGPALEDPTAPNETTPSSKEN